LGEDATDREDVDLAPIDADGLRRELPFTD
jgi:hypothetical protein